MPRKPAPPPPTAVLAPRWGVYMIRKRGERIGAVRAADAAAALQEARNQYAETEIERARISVQPEER